MRHTRRFRKHAATVQRIAGGILIIMSIAMLTGHLNRLSIWLLKNLTWLNTLG